MKKSIILTLGLMVAGLAWAEIQPIDGDNVVGFVPVTASNSINSIISVPFEACVGSNGYAGTLANLIATNGLTSHDTDSTKADNLVVLTEIDATNQVYYYYYYQTGFSNGWQGITSSQVMPDGTSTNRTPPLAIDFPLNRGMGFWIKRQTNSVSNVNTLYIKGQVNTNGQITAIEKGLNLIGYGSVAPFALNGAGVSWEGAYGTNITTYADKILVGKGDGTGTYNAYYYIIDSGDSTRHQKWVDQSGTVASNAIPTGQGFWYQRRGTNSFNFIP